MKARVFCFFLALMALSSWAKAEPNRKLIYAPPTRVEIALLPEYCTAKKIYGFNRDNPLVRKYIALFGPDYTHIHHL